MNNNDHKSANILPESEWKPKMGELVWTGMPVPRGAELRMEVRKHLLCEVIPRHFDHAEYWLLYEIRQDGTSAPDGTLWNRQHVFPSQVAALEHVMKLIKEQACKLSDLHAEVSRRVDALRPQPPVGTGVKTVGEATSGIASALTFNRKTNHGS